MSDSTEGSEYCGPDVPTPLGDQLQLALGLDERPRTFGDWVDALAFIANRDYIDVNLNMLCTTDDSPHKATFNGQTQHYQCFQDPIIVPFLTDDVDIVDIETECPVSGGSIKLRVTETEIEATPPDVVMSFGVADWVDAPPEDVASPILAYSLFCPYGNVFRSHEEYEAWAADVDAITMPTTVDDALELARAIGHVAKQTPTHVHRTVSLDSPSLAVDEIKPPKGLGESPTALDGVQLVEVRRSMTNRPSSTYHEIEIPPAIADQLQIAFALPRTPTTLGEWVTITSNVAADVGLIVGMETLCTAETSRHQAKIDDETRYFHCVLDALIVPFLLDTGDSVTIRSESPVSDAVVEIHAGQDSLTVDPPDAVMSFGVVTDIDAPDAEDVDLSLGYKWFCPYTNAFPTEAEYEEWALQTDAVTLAMPLDIAHQLASDIPDSVPSK